MSTIPLTKRGAEQLRDELQRLKSVERPAVINAIAEARAQGDLSENAEYDAAKEKQGFIEGRIAELESSCPPRKSSIPRCSTPMAAWCSPRRSNSRISSRATPSSTRSSATTKPISITA